MATLENSSNLMPPDKDDDESSEFGSDYEDFDESVRLVRVLGQHRRVTGVFERKIWPIDGLFEASPNMKQHEIHEMIKKEGEKEQKRRISAPYNASIDITDIEWFHRSQKLSNVHEQLLRLFSVHQAIYLTKCEQQARINEANKRILHEELVRKVARLAVKESVENERSRKIAVIKEMAEGWGDDVEEAAERHSKLSSVHDELSESFKFAWKVMEEREEKQRQEEEFFEEQIRRAASRRSSAQLEEDERQRRIDQYKRSNSDYESLKSKISDVQHELIHLFDGNMKSPGRIECIEDTTNSSAEVGQSDEDSLRLANTEKAKLLMTIEQERRMTTRLTEKELLDNMQIVEKLFAIHKQLREKLTE